MPKEKEETNFLYEEIGQSANKVKGDKRGNKSKASRSPLGRVNEEGMGNKGLLMKAWKIRGNYFFPWPTLLL